MRKILIIYGTTEGQTAKIAQCLAEHIGERGYLVDVYDVTHLPTDFALDGYNAVLVGASMHVGGYQRAIREFVARHQVMLTRLPSAFFSVSLTEAYPDPQERARLNSHFAHFFYETGWHPAMMASFAGALAYTRYGFFKRLALRYIARRAGAPTNPARDYEFTDWDAVTSFAEGFVALLAPEPAAAR
jgi:menaquinone-dependent protoporphyrinogen oxidase